MEQTIKEFTNELTRRVAERLGDTFAVRSATVMKVNTELTAISIINKEVDSNITPQMYVNSYYHQFLNSNLDWDDIVDAVIRNYEEHKIDEAISMDFFMDWEQVKSKVEPRLVNREWNTELLATVPHTEVLDLAIVYYVTIHMDSEGAGSILIKNDHLNIWGIDKDELNRVAFEENGVFNKAKLQSMESIFRGMIEDELPMDMNISDDDIAGMVDAVVERGSKMMVLSNASNMFGSVQFLNTDLLEELAEKLESNLCILGSSIHEVIIVPCEDESDACMFAEMIQSVNEEQVQISDRLAKVPYFYRRGTKKIDFMEEK